GMGPGGAAPGGGPGGNADQPADFRTPQGAVMAFMNAVKARDLARLTEATALRAGTEAETKKRYQETFRRIFDGTLSESELNQLAALLEGYQISGQNQQKSSNRAGIILSKRGGTNSMSTKSIVLYVRLEKKGWGVCDISLPAEIKGPNYARPRG